MKYLNYIYAAVGNRISEQNQMKRVSMAAARLIEEGYPMNIAIDIAIEIDRGGY